MLGSDTEPTFTTTNLAKAPSFVARIPLELIPSIVIQLDAKSAAHFSATCHEFNRIVKQNHVIYHTFRRVVATTLPQHLLATPLPKQNAKSSLTSSASKWLRLKSNPFVATILDTIADGQLEPTLLHQKQFIRSCMGSSVFRQEHTDHRKETSRTYKVSLRSGPFKDGYFNLIRKELGTACFARPSYCISIEVPPPNTKQNSIFDLIEDYDPLIQAQMAEWWKQEMKSSKPQAFLWKWSCKGYWEWEQLIGNPKWTWEQMFNRSVRVLLEGLVEEEEQVWAVQNYSWTSFSSASILYNLCKDPGVDSKQTLQKLIEIAAFPKVEGLGSDAFRNIIGGVAGAFVDADTSKPTVSKLFLRYWISVCCNPIQRALKVTDDFIQLELDGRVQFRFLQG